MGWPTVWVQIDLALGLQLKAELEGWNNENTWNLVQHDDDENDDLD